MTARGAVRRRDWVTNRWGQRVESATRQRAKRWLTPGRLRASLAVAVFFAAVAGMLAWASAGAPTLVASSGRVGLWRTVDGVAFSMAFDRPLPVRDLRDTFAFNGSATPGIGYESLGARGLTIGVRRHPNRFEGWFAVTTAAFPAAGVYHVRMARPPGDVDAGNAQGEAVFAVQTGTTKRDGLINYVVVASNSRGGRTSWTIGYAHGHLADARLEVLDRLAPAVTSPLARDVTITTDGHRRLDVWFGRRLVYASNHLHLDIEPPFQPYLEVQSLRVPYASYFHNAWITSSSAIDVTGAPAGARLTLVAADGGVISSATSQAGTARLELPPPLARGTATLVVRSGGARVRLGTFAYAGGDSYLVTGLGSAGPSHGPGSATGPVTRHT